MIKSLNVLLRRSSSTTILRACIWKLNAYPAGGFWRETVPRAFFCCTSKLFKADEDPVEYPLEVRKIRNFFTGGEKWHLKIPDQHSKYSAILASPRNVSCYMIWAESQLAILFPKVLFHVVHCWDHVEYRVRRESRKNECWTKEG